MFFAGFYHMTNRQDWLKEIFFLSVFSPNVFIISCWIKPDCYCSEEEWLLNRVGGGCWQRENYCKWLAQWEGRGKVLIRCACCGLQTTFMNFGRDRLTYYCLSLCLHVCVLDKERTARQRKHMRYFKGHETQEKHHSFLLIIWALVGGFVGLCWLINSLGTDLLRLDRCWHRLGGLFPELWAFTGFIIAKGLGLFS